MVKYFLPFLIAACSLHSYGQDTLTSTKKERHWFDTKDSYHLNRLYIYWGYNRSVFSTSDIHFHGMGYDFTVYHVTAHDRPSKFTFDNYFNPSHISIPQYNIRMGFYVFRNFHLSFWHRPHEIRDGPGANR